MLLTLLTFIYLPLYYVILDQIEPFILLGDSLLFCFVRLYGMST